MGQNILGQPTVHQGRASKNLLYVCVCAQSLLSDGKKKNTGVKRLMWKYMAQINMASGDDLTLTHNEGSEHELIND